MNYKFNTLYKILLIIIFSFFFLINSNSMTTISNVQNVILFIRNSAPKYENTFNDYKFYECFYKFIKSIIINLIKIK
jgi:hypothetical protein